METTAKILEDSLLVIWNDRDAQRRLSAMQNIYADDMAFYESNDGQAIIGHEAINNVIAGLQSQWPDEFKFELLSPAMMNRQVQYITWRLGVPGSEAVATGADVAIVEDGKIKSLHLFLNKAEN